MLVADDVPATIYLPPAVGAIEVNSPLQAVSIDLNVLRFCRYPHRCDHAHHEYPNSYGPIDDAGRATVEQTEIAGQ